MYIDNPDQMFLIYELRSVQTDVLVFEGTLEAVMNEVYKHRYIVENINRWISQLRLNWRKYV